MLIIEDRFGWHFAGQESIPRTRPRKRDAAWPSRPQRSQRPANPVDPDMGSWTEQWQVRKALVSALISFQLNGSKPNSGLRWRSYRPITRLWRRVEVDIGAVQAPTLIPTGSHVLTRSLNCHPADWTQSISTLKLNLVIDYWLSNIDLDSVNDYFDPRNPWQANDENNNSVRCIHACMGQTVLFFRIW